MTVMLKRIVSRTTDFEFGVNDASKFIKLSQSGLKLSRSFKSFKVDHLKIGRDVLFSCKLYIAQKYDVEIMLLCTYWTGT